MGTKEGLYSQIAKSLSQNIIQNRYQDKIPTEVSLAKEFDVSVPTIKRAMAVLVQNDIVTRIPGKGTFVKNAEKAKEISWENQDGKQAGGATKPLIIGVIIPTIAEGFASRMVDGITNALSDHNAHTLLGISHDDREKESRMIADFLTLDVDGLMIFPVEGELYSQDIVRLSLDDFPLVLVDRWLPGIDVSRVVSQNADGTSKAVDYLYKLGHQHIAMVSVSSSYPLSTQSIIERKNGFLKALDNNGSTSGERWVWLEQLNEAGNRKVAIECIVQKIRANPEITALIGLSSSDTELAFEAANQMGMKVPDDISIIGFDIGDMPHEVACFISGESSSIRRVSWLDQSEYVIGQEAANLIRRLIDDPKCTEVIEVPIEFHIGDTCSAPREIT